MKFTVADAMKLYPLSEGKIIAGRKGLSNEVTSVSVLEIPNASAMKFIRPGQLEISAFYSVADSEAEQLNAIRMLHKCKISALIISHVGLILKTIPQSMVDLCNELKLPLILMPESTEYIEIISPILDRLLKTQNQQLEYAMQIYDKMTNLILEERDFDYLISTLGKMVKRQVLFYDYQNICVANSGSRLSGELEEFIARKIKENTSLFMAERNEIKFPAPSSKNNSVLFVPVISSLKYYGVLVILNADNLSELDLVAIAQTKNALGIITLNNINIKEYNILLRNDFINDLVQWNFANEDVAVQRGLALDYDITKIRVAMVLDLHRFSQLSDKYTEKQLLKFKAEFFETVKSEMAHISPASILMNFSDKILVLYAETKLGKRQTIARLRDIGDYLLKVVRQTHSLEISAGIGSYCDSIPAIKQSYQHARLALRISSRIFGGPHCVQYDDIKIYCLLSNLIKPKDIAGPIEDFLLPLKQHDKENNTQLLKTFQLLLDNDLDTAKVAEKLFLHRNTILQRKKKIGELFNFDPFARANRMQFELAFLLENLVAEDRASAASE